MADIEISKFVSGIVGGKSTASRSNPRRCHKTSTSSGYSSHSPPLSAGSYSYYASASTRDPSYGGLAVIHESEGIPRPIWPSVIYHHAEDHSGEYEGNESDESPLRSLLLLGKLVYRNVFVLSQQVFIRVAYAVARITIRHHYRRRRRRRRRHSQEHARCCSNCPELSIL